LSEVLKDVSENERTRRSAVASDWVASKRNSEAVRWYVLVLPSCHKGLAIGLRQEKERRIRDGEPSLEFFAPSYVEVKRVDGRFVNTHRPLLFNYVFVRSSEKEIYRMKRFLPQYNFLPRVRKGGSDGHYPYLSDEAMRNLQWVARSYAETLPVYAPEEKRLMKGDRVRITEGQFKGVEASVVIQPGAGHKDVVVCVDNWMWVPLLHVGPGEYEVIALNDAGKHVYARLDNDRLLSGLHEALRHCVGTERPTDEECALAEEALRQYGSLQMESDVMRCKLYAIQLLAYTILGLEEKRDVLVGAVREILPAVKAEQAKALLLVTLYGCLDNSLYHVQAHALIDCWRMEEQPKKNKARLMRWLDDYDNWLGH